ncbi:MAG TPA: hypothetical protein VN933_10665 [Candidatus Eremiobacteraceae bacterium]|jgi:hypothetical protein|nr:hypothetical protein [Candidatus Eremiobacteraceae bacterium]
MSTNINHGHHGAAGEEPRNDDVSFETADVHPATIYWYLGALAVAVILSYIVCIFVLRVTTKIAVDYDTPPPAIRQEMGSSYDALPPEPRMQGVPGHPSDPQADLRNKNAADNAANETTGWIDQNAGIAQIPVSEAMKIIAEKGLPGTPASAEKK